MAEPTDEPDQQHKNTTTTTTTTTTTSTSWGTLEELLLACAVNRYGTTSWDSVATELQKRISFSLLKITPHICHQKYRDLKRRFADEFSDRNRNADDHNSNNNTSFWLDELRKLRVAELRSELERYDLSIVSLQTKVKRLTEERENSDLEKINEPPENFAGDEEFCRKNESNSEKEPEIELIKPKPVEPDRVGEPEDSCNGSSNSKEPESVKPDRVDSGELVESVSESKGEKEGEEERVKESQSSDVQSAASLSRREKKTKPIVVVMAVSGNSSGEENQSHASKSAKGGGKAQPLIELFELVRASKVGSVFGRRLESQESPKYRSLIRQHIDLGMIQRRLEEGQYAGCHAKFYRDLMLLINNAIVYFTNKSSEHKAALELRQLVTKQIKSRPYTHKSQVSKPHPPPPKPPKSEADVTNVKPILALTGPVIACRKRSSIAGKPSTTGEKKEPALVSPPGEKPAAKEVVKQPDEEKTLSSFSAVTKKRTRDQGVGSKSSSSKNNNNQSSSKSARPSPTSIQKPSPSTPSTKGENSEAKVEKKKSSPDNSSNKIKRGSGSGSGSLLELLKNSAEKKNVNSSSAGTKSDRRKDQVVSRNRPGKETLKGKEGKQERQSAANKSTGRPPKRAAAIAAMGGKRGREGGGEAEALPKKRLRK